MVGGRGFSSNTSYFLPVFRLGGELITSDNSPFGQVDACLGQKNVACLNADVWIGLHEISSRKAVADYLILIQYDENNAESDLLQGIREGNTYLTFCQRGDAKLESPPT